MFGRSRLYNSTLPPTPSDHPSAGYLRGLDGLRLVAVSIVVLAHFRVASQLPGGFGVTVFFAISGFLICRLLLAEELTTGSIGLFRFFSRRAMRLMPSLVIMLVLTATIYLVVDPASFNPIQLTLALLYLGNLPIVVENLGGPAIGGARGYGVLWSLAVEEHFYLLFPFVLILFRKNSSRIQVILGVILGSLVLRIMFWFALTNADNVNYYFTLTRLDSIACGCLLTLLLAEGNVWTRVLSKWRGAWGLVGAIFLLFAAIGFRGEFFQSTFLYTIHGIGMLLLLNAFVFGNPIPFIMRIAEIKYIRLGGRISYEIYLWHVHVYELVGRAIEYYLLRLSVSIVLTVLIAYLTFKVSGHFTRWIGSVGLFPQARGELHGDRVVSK